MTSATARRPQLAHLTAQLDDLRRRGTHFKLRILEDEQAPVCTYDGKQVIHPDQIAPTRDAFSPTPAEVADARRTIDALAAAQAAGLAAVSLDGKLVDFANIRMAERILAMAPV